MSKYIFVTGGVVSGLGKGIVAASLGRLLKNRGLRVSSQKLDPYMNIDPGTMSPFQHGEVFVTDDGAETDLDLGHYERFIDENLTKYSNLTSGRVYYNVLMKERRGEYLGQTVQIIPHVTNEIKLFITKNLSEQEDSSNMVALVEIGGTVGDIEQQAFLEAVRQLSTTVGRHNCVFIHVCLVPYITGSDEFKSKPAQHSVRELQATGIRPDIIVARSDLDVPQEIKDKISLFCNVSPDCVISNRTLDCLYEVPLMLHAQKMDSIVCDKLELRTPDPDLKEWENLVASIHNRNGSITVALVGKYIKLHDSYLSIVEALNHASFVLGKKVSIKWIDSDSVNDQSAPQIFAGCAGIILPGGFGTRGIEGMICACRYARTHALPYFGICLGMQVAVIEFARSVLGWADANSSEFEPASTHCVIDLMEGQAGVQKGGTMRLGSYPCVVARGTLLHKAYFEQEDNGAKFTDSAGIDNQNQGEQKDLIAERHRHRYEFSNKYRTELLGAGLVLSGQSPDGLLVEAIELPQAMHKHYIGVQYHPEFKSRPNRPQPLFVQFLKSCVG